MAELKCRYSKEMCPYVPVALSIKCDECMVKKAYKRGFYEQQPGEWIKGKEISRTMLCDKSLHIDYKDFTCSVCGLVLDRMLYHVDGSPFYNFCPNCGTPMTEKALEIIRNRRR